MVHSSTTTPSSNKEDVLFRHEVKIYLLPGILVPAYHDTRVILVHEQHGFLDILIFEEPTSSMVNWCSM